MSITPTPGSNLNETPESPAGGGGNRFQTFMAVAIVVLLLLVIYLGVSLRSIQQTLQTQNKETSDKIARLTTRLDATDDRTANLKAQLDVTSEKLGLTTQELSRAHAMATTIKKQQQESNQRLVSQMGQLKAEQEQKIGAVSSEVTGVKTEVAGAKQEIQEVKIKLERAIGDLGVQSGLIAKNRDELEELKRRGERNYFEFDLVKSDRFTRVGEIQVRLKKADRKKNRFNLEVIADDKKIPKDNKTINEPVQFYVAKAKTPFEILVYDVQKDRVIGYLSTPKVLAQR